MAHLTKRASRKARDMARRMQAPIGNFTPKDLAGAMLRGGFSPVGLSQHLKISKNSVTEMLKGHRDIDAAVTQWMKGANNDKTDS